MPNSTENEEHLHSRIWRISYASLPQSPGGSQFSETLFEDDLGITGDDGCELLEAAEKHFGVCLSSPEEGYRRTFDLAPHEFLFHSEGLGWDLSDLVSLFRPSATPSSIKAFKVGDLFEAIKKAPPIPVKPVSILGLED